MATILTKDVIGDALLRTVRFEDGDVLLVTYPADQPSVRFQEGAEFWKGVMEHVSRNTGKVIAFVLFAGDKVRVRSADRVVRDTSPADEMGGAKGERRALLRGDELLLSDGERAVRVPISTAIDALFPIAEALDAPRLQEEVLGGQ